MINEEYIKSAGWHFDNSYETLPPFFYSNIELNPVSTPELVVFNEALATQLGLNVEQLQTEEAIAIFAGNDFPKVLHKLLKHMEGINLATLIC